MLKTAESYSLNRPDPVFDRVAYQPTLKEFAVDVPSRTCITRDNIAVEVDGLLYLQIIDPVKASYGIEDYLFASSQLAQTTMRSEIGNLARTNNTMIIPQSMTDLAGTVAAATRVIGEVKPDRQETVES